MFTELQYSFCHTGMGRLLNKGGVYSSLLPYSAKFLRCIIFTFVGLVWNHPWLSMSLGLVFWWWLKDSCETALGAVTGCSLTWIHWVQSHMNPWGAGSCLLHSLFYRIPSRPADTRDILICWQLDYHLFDEGKLSRYMNTVVSQH